MSDEENDNKTEAASPRKREESRNKGNFASSSDLSSAAAIAAGLIALASFGPRIFETQLNLMRGWLTGLDGHASVADLLNEKLPLFLPPIALALCSAILVILGTSMVIGFVQAGLHFNLDWLAPKWERINPLEGFTRLFSLNSLMSAIFGTVKLIVVTWFAYQTLCTIFITAPSLYQVSTKSLLPMVSELMLSLCWSVTVPLLLLAAADYGYKFWKHEKDLMMSREELKQENRQQEGDPHVKQRIRGIQRQRALKRMMQDVPKATVIVTNPTHVAIALRYEPGMAAPIVVAKGEHLVAQRIKAIGFQHDIPVIEEPPLARAMLRVVQIGQEIPLEFYRAVAEILALLYRRKNGIAKAPARRSA